MRKIVIVASALFWAAVGCATQWHHDILHMDGTRYHAEETGLLKAPLKGQPAMD